MVKPERIDMTRGSTLFLRAAVLGLGFIVALLGALLGQAIYEEWPGQFPNIINLRYLALVVIAVVICAFWTALYQAMKLLNYIDKNTVFSKLSVAALRNVKYAALVMAIALCAGMPVIYLVAQKDDAPGLILIGMAFAAAPVVVAVAAAVGQRLLQTVITIKSENDLTV